MTAVRGWCPDLFAPMRAGDGWLVRLKPRLARITASDGRHIATASATFGNSVIELTRRGNLQLRGLTPASAAAFARLAVDVGLASADPAIERRRNISLSPMAGAAARAVATNLEQQLASDHALAALPGKFGFGIDAGGPWPLASGSADILLRIQDGVWQVGFAGAGGAAAADPVPAAIALAHAWLQTGATTRPARHASESPAAAPVGWQPQCQAFGFGLPFGQMDAALLHRLCALSQRFGDGVLHLTPWRAILLSGVRGPDVPQLAAAAAGLIIEPGDPRLRASACIGRSGCISGSVDARADAASLLARGVRAESLHVSGCDKGCAHPGPSDITLVGKDGRYGLVRAGRAGDTAQEHGLTLCQAAARLGGSKAGLDDNR